MEPPRPPLTPVERPNSSAKIPSIGTPFATAWPWPRCVLVTMSSRVSAAQTPTAHASWPIEEWNDPFMRPRLCSRLDAELDRPDELHLRYRSSAGERPSVPAATAGSKR